MQQELTFRSIFFVCTLAAIAAWELLAPRRQLVDSKKRRWLINLSLVLINTLAVRLLIPVLPVGLALMLQERGWGILNLFALPYVLNIIITLLLLDLVIYFQHALFHYLPALWRIHRVHHTDLDIDVTTGNRFHLLEIIISIVVKIAAVTLIGPPIIAVVLFEILLNACAQFNHGNIWIPEKVDSFLRLFVVTPDMHRVHHSIIPRETNSNFGFNVPWWDRLFGTYRSQPEQGHLEMSIGLREYRDPAQLTLWKVLTGIRGG